MIFNKKFFVILVWVGYSVIIFKEINVWDIEVNRNLVTERFVLIIYGFIINFFKIIYYVYGFCVFKVYIGYRGYCLFFWIIKIEV